MAGHPNGSASTNGQVTATSFSVTRDCIHFRTLKTPLAVVADRFFTLLSSDSAQGRAARKCFAHSALDHPLNTAECPADLDNQIRIAFQKETRPSVVLVQGAFRPDNVLGHDDVPTPSTPSSINTLGHLSLDSAKPSNFVEVIFASFTLHNEYQRCLKEDKEQAARLAWYFVLLLAHETSHWLYTRIHSFTRDPLRPSQREMASRNGNSSPGSTMSHFSRTSNGSIATAVSIHGQRVEDPLITLGQNREDCGARTTDMLLGCTGAVVSFADGDADVVKRKIQPSITNDTPALGAAEVEYITGHKMPKFIDITGSPPLLIGGPTPKWSTHDTYLPTSKVVPNSLCQHGACRIGSLF
ncbi:hypothetical protein EMMF5_003995 [Cystobasidiomycetes sp. EMM_F5]